MRIIRGKLKSRRFSIPKGFPSRPTTDFAKEGFFNMLENRLDLHELEILDLCAGTGNITFEFASREAGRITAVDRNFNCIRFIHRQAEAFGIGDVIQTVKSDVLAFLKKTDRKYDLIFSDPPYDVSFHEELIALVFERELLNEDGSLIVEHGSRTDLSGITHFESSRIYGNVHFSFFKK